MFFPHKGACRKEKGSVVAITIFLCYAHEDKGMADELKKHLSLLEKERLIRTWGYHDIEPGAEWEQGMKKRLNEAQVILLLMSVDFINSPDCYDIQMPQAIRRHERQEAHVIPIILRPCSWEISPIGKLKPLPDNNKPITKWQTEEDGFYNVAAGITQVVMQLKEKPLIVNFDKVIANIKSQLQTQERAEKMANTLQHLSIYIPDGVTLADLVVGWRILSQSSQTEEGIAVRRRRITCGELATLASQFTTDQGNIAQAIKTWQAWRTAFEKSDDPRQSAMASTFAREVGELQTVAP
jgi:hypothetical protein